MSRAELVFLSGWQQRSEQALERQLNALTTVSPRLLAAMRYSLLGKGKRIRPVLSYAGAASVGEITDAVDDVACAVECIHAYSLVHDDLPAMDDDDLRRGQPTCHIAFDEATAILAGDALQTLAFQILAGAALPPQDSLALIARLAEASGASGMVAGQAVDLAAVSRQLSLSELEQMHRFKTGALIRASVSMGALATGAASPEQLAALGRFGDSIGLAFQVQDDILDVAGTTEEIGKQQGADALRDKPTYVSLLGLDQARRKARDFHEAALEALSHFDQRADPLRQLSTYIVERSS
ncbi:(2E,6E)-farnesyl diphosphate synthase [Proteobacteria bacterium 005FR1]|nr:(2E,6E)-farnesyl diphosphate synthase [Proteobacteria bacterium 005FR1]